MKITSAQVTRYTISGLETQDPIVFIFEDFGPGKGRAIIECFGDAWSYFWPAMGGFTIPQFFRKAGTDYLANKLYGGNHRENDWDKFRASFRAEILNQRRSNEITKFAAREAFGLTIDHEFDAQENFNTISEIMGDDFFERIPERDKTDYVWLTEIIDYIKFAIDELGIADRAA